MPYNVEYISIGVMSLSLAKATAHISNGGSLEEKKNKQCFQTKRKRKYYPFSSTHVNKGHSCPFLPPFLNVNIPQTETHFQKFLESLHPFNV